MHEHDLYPYPKQLSQDVFAVVLEAVKTGNLSAPCLRHACWEVVGYGLGQFEGPMLISATPIVLADVTAATPVSTLPWAVLLPLILELIKLLNK